MFIIDMHHHICNNMYTGQQVPHHYTMINAVEEYVFNADQFDKSFGFRFHSRENWLGSHGCT